LTLGSLIGQETAALVLANAIRRDRLAHAYLFTGPEAVGKRTAALAFAKALNCLGHPAPGECCDACRTCADIEAGFHPDIRLITPAVQLPPDAPPELLDALGERAAITIGQIRPQPGKPQAPPPLLADALLRPHSARRKVYLIDPADRMNAEAANALLHLLEEPPPLVTLVLVTSRQAALLPTILSRCQQVQFHLAPREQVEQLLVARGAPPERARFLASLAGGRPGWAVTAWARPETLATRERMLDFLAGLAGQPTRSALRSAAQLKELALATWAQELSAESQPADDDEPETEDKPARISTDRALRMRLPQLLEQALGWYRDVLTCQAGTAELVVNSDRLPELQAVAGQLSPASVAACLGALEQTKGYLQRNANVDLALEGMFIRLAGVHQG